MMGVFVQFFNVLSPVVMGDILSRLVWCVEQGKAVCEPEGRRGVLRGEQGCAQRGAGVCSEGSRGVLRGEEG